MGSGSTAATATGESVVAVVEGVAHQEEATALTPGAQDDGDRDEVPSSSRQVPLTDEQVLEEGNFLLVELLGWWPRSFRMCTFGTELIGLNRVLSWVNHVMNVKTLPLSRRCLRGLRARS